MKLCITVDEIKQIFECLIQRINNDNIESVDVEIDYYWLITSDEWDNFDSSPEIAVGSLVDDWDSLQEVLESKRIITYLDYERFASILRAISETIAPSKKKSVEDNNQQNQINLTEKEAYAAMYVFLVKLYERTQSDDLGGLLGDMSTTGDGETADPAAWHEWLQCVAQVKQGIFDVDLHIQS